MSSKSSSGDFNQKIGEFLPRFSGIMLLVATIILPLIVLPIGENFLLESKNLIFFIVGVIIFAIWTLTAFLKKTVQVTLSTFLFPSILLLISTLLSSFLNGLYPINHLVGFGGIYIACSLIILLAPSLIPEKYGKFFPFIVALPALLLSLMSMAELMGVGPSVVFNSLFKLDLPSSPIFSVSGSPLLAMEVIFIALSGCVTMVLTGKRLVKPFFILCSVVLLAGLIIDGRALVQQKIFTDVLPSFNASWSVGTDTLKSVKATVVGVGPESYQQSYLRYKPAWINTKPIWSLQFNQASDTPLTLIVTQGILGVAAWVLLSLAIVDRARKSTAQTRPFAAMGIASVILQLLLPPNIVLVAIQSLLLVFWVVAEKNTLKDVQVHAFTVQLIKSGADVQKVPKHSNFLVYFITGMSALSIAVCTVLLSKFVFAQYQMFQGILGTLHNNAVQVYTAQQKAVSINPYSATYVRSFTNTNLAIAQAMAQKQDLSEQEKEQVITLIKQAIDQSKNAITIEPENSLNWLANARIYSNLIGGAEGADTMAISGYEQALAFSPNDPITNLELGSLYYRTAKYPLAVQQLEKTVQLKPDWPNAYYNLANAYRQNKQLQQAYDAYQQTLVLLPTGDDYSKVKIEQDEVQKALQAAQAQSQSKVQGITTPEVTPVAKPVQTVAPQPSPSPTPTPAPEVSPSSSPTEEVNPSVQPGE